MGGKFYKGKKVAAMANSEGKGSLPMTSVDWACAKSTQYYIIACVLKSR